MRTLFRIMALAIVMTLAAGAIASAQQSGNTLVTVGVEAYYYGFDPGEVVVREGDTVRLVVTNNPDRKMDELVEFPTGDEFPDHGLAVEGFDVDTGRIGPYETAIIEFVADEPGEYRMYCSVWCGNGTLRGDVQYGHGQQVANLVVLPAD